MPTVDMHNMKPSTSRAIKQNLNHIGGIYQDTREYDFSEECYIKRVKYP